MVESAKLHPAMRDPATCLIFNPDDFKQIQQLIHEDAFGHNHGITPLAKLGEKLVVWKIPADMNGLKGYTPVASPNDVGDYPMEDDE